ncbi:acetate kinase [Canibacter sp. lx-72]|uniref:acetate/propionate family kinase n=1 Tax=Canibacter zhuwentaonis TaxID=2837491 RepID=UPI001BDDB129|nr:acetate kinase [Canibacter zhuwentaonis]MBT1018540.1 acetate kinase [Canibacter zhuwentaonis]
MSTVLVINSGSSSLKYQLVNTVDGSKIAAGLVERIGLPGANIAHEQNGIKTQHTREIPDHTFAFAAVTRVFAEQQMPFESLQLTAVGHRVVQGGEKFIEPTLITDEVERAIAELSALAPLHNPGQLAGIRAARKVFPKTAHVAVFDTAFHQSMPPAAYEYALDQNTARQYSIRRYGFHGTSHSYVARRAAEFLGRPVSDLKQVVLHLGNGASACAVQGGTSINTSMGLTPLQGLVMGTRTGDIDASVVFHLHRTAGMSIDEIDTLFNKQSGLLGLSGSADMRDVTAAAASGDARATQALAVYTHRIRHYLGAYAFELGGLDTVIFTAGVGENVPQIRAAVCADLAAYGIVLDSALNQQHSRKVREISAAESRVRVLVVPTDEELEIALQAQSLVASL